MLKKVGKLETTYLSGNEIPSIKYHIFEDIAFVNSGFSTKIGGVSKGQFESLNFSVKMGDSKENVEKNFKLFLEANDFQNPVMADQTHTTNVERVYMEDAGKNVFREKDFSDVDGFVTDERKLTLVTTFADCIPLYFVDEEHKAIGLSHSGWKGTIGRIGKNTINLMKQEFGTQVSTLKVAIGPSICGKCYEISKELAFEFANEFQMKIEKVLSNEEINSQNMEKLVYNIGEEYYLNLWSANYKVLTDAGVRRENIAIPDVCTCCNSEMLFSHRATKGKRGNLCAFLEIK